MDPSHYYLKTILLLFFLDNIVSGQNTEKVDDSDIHAKVKDYIARDCGVEDATGKAIDCGTNISDWDTSGVTNMSYLFYNADGKSSSFNQDLSKWNTSSVTHMNWMFKGARSFNSDLNWDVSNVVNMNGMFSGATSFNGDISSWNPKNVTSMNYMFQDATSFNRDISSWNISSVKEMNYMFMFTSSYNQNLCDWGDKFPYDSATNIFFNSGCTNTSTPLWVSKGSWEYKKGPFCASASCPPFDSVSYACSQSGCIISFH